MNKKFKEGYNIVYVNCHKATLELNFEILSEDIIDGIILFRIGLSLLSYGEVFKVTITRMEPEYTSVSVESESSVKFQLFDWGKNEKNISDFFDKLSMLLKK